MYQLTVTVSETIGCYICKLVISSVDQFGSVTRIAASRPTYLEVDPVFLEDDIVQILRASERFVRKMADTPSK